MSDESHTSGSSGCGGVPVIRACIGCALFLGVLWFAYVKQFPHAELGDGVHTAQQREETLKKLQLKMAADSTTYGWVDKDKQVVRLPIDRAMQLTVEDLNAAKK
jgi:hypothetical protein